MLFAKIFRIALVVCCALFVTLPTLTLGNQMQPKACEQLSAREQKWFETFQKGTFYARGWREITAELLAKAPVETKDDLKHRLEELGQKIGREWSKNNDIRKIDNTMLRHWGDQLQQVAKREPTKIVQVVASLNQKVCTILD